MDISSPASQPNAPSMGHSCKLFLQLRTEVLGAGPELRLFWGPRLLRGVLAFVCVPASAVCQTGCSGSNMKLTTLLCFGD